MSLDYSMTVKLLTEHQIHLEFLSLKGGSTGSSESTLVKMPHCCKSRIRAQLSISIISPNFRTIRPAVTENSSEQNLGGKKRKKREENEQEE